MENQFYRGQNLLLDKQKLVAIIGPRKASPAELGIAHSFAQKCASKGKIVVSGLAEGIDTAAHQGTIDAGGQTIAIVNTPPHQSLYPKNNQKLGDEIIQHNGMIFFPFQTQAPFEKGNGMKRFTKRLLERDVLLAHLCPIIVAVSDTPIIKGGTRWGVEHGKFFDKEVFRLDSFGALHHNPESEKSEQCHIFWDSEIDFKKIRGK